MLVAYYQLWCCNDWTWVAGAGVLVFRYVLRTQFDKLGLERMIERGVTQKIVQTWRSNGKVLQQTSDKFYILFNRAL